MAASEARMKWVAVLTAGLLGAAAPAAAESLLDSLGRSAGLVAPEPDMLDFVKASRPQGTPTPLPAFASPPEPKSKVKSADELNAMDSHLERAAARARGDAPAVKVAKKKTPRP
jgi:hypothetical protein